MQDYRIMKKYWLIKMRIGNGYKPIIHLKSLVFFMSLCLLFFYVTGFSACRNSKQKEGENNKEGFISSDNLSDTYDNRRLEDSTIAENSLLKGTAPTIPADAINVKSYGAIGDGLTDDVKAINKAIVEAVKQNVAVYFPKGQYAIGKPGIRLAYSNIELVGISRDEVIIKPIHDVTALVTSIGNVKDIHDFTARNITFQCESKEASSSFAILLFGGLRNVKVDHCRFKDISQTYVRLNNVYNVTLSNSLYTNTGAIKNGTFVLVRNCSTIKFLNNRLSGYYNGFYVYPQPPTEKAEDIIVEDNVFDGRWYLTQEHLSSEGGAVSYTDNSIKDSKTNFLKYVTNFSRRVTHKTVAEWRLARALSPRGNGKAQLNDRIINDPNAHFRRWGVIPGEVIEVGDSRGVIEEVLSDTKLSIEYWYNKMEVGVVPPPSGQVSYTVFALYLGRTIGFNAHSVQVTEWHNLNGKILTPPQGSRYEIIKRVPLYGLYFTKDVRNVTIANNRLLRNYADQIGWQGSNAIIKNNYIKDGQDVGITVSNRNLLGSVITDNHVQRQGSCGIFINGNGNEVMGNTIVGPIPTVNLYNDSTLAGIQVMGGSENLVHKNRINLMNTLNGHGITLSERVKSINKIENNIIENVSDERKINLFDDKSSLRNKWQFEPNKKNPQ